MKIGYHEIAPGVKSHGRLITSIMLALFGLVVFVGVTMSILDWIVKDAANLGSWVGLTIAALSMEGVAGVMKVWTKKVETNGDGYAK